MNHHRTTVSGSALLALALATMTLAACGSSDD
jgi:hypothetical protein